MTYMLLLNCALKLVEEIILPVPVNRKLSVLGTQLIIPLNGAPNQRNYDVRS